MSPSADTVYLGFANLNKAIRIVGHSIVILIKGEVSCVLRGDEAEAFREDLNETHNHLMGFQHSNHVATRIADIPSHIYDHPIYDEVFERYFKS